MSYWTHVAAIFRVDCIRAIMPEPDFDELFGRECLWESPEETWDDTTEHPDRYLPMGSEGSLEKSVWINPDRSYMASYTVSVFGDLRDVSEPDGIERWFRDCCSKVWIRQAVCQIECEYGETKVLTN